MEATDHIAVERYLWPTGVIYEDVFRLHLLYDKLIGSGSNLILSGPKGIGKSLSIASYAEANHIPLITFDCSEDVRRSHLIGTFILRGDNTPFILGPVTSVFDVANAQGQCILLLEEVNSLTPQSQKILNPLTDFRRKIDVPEAGRVFRLEDKSTIWIVGTMNDAGSGGVYPLNDDLKSRFRILPLPYMDVADEERVVARALAGRLTALGLKLADLPVKGVLTLAQETRQGALAYAMSTRDVVQLLEDIAVFGKIASTFNLLLGKFELDDQKTVLTRIRSIFGKLL